MDDLRIIREVKKRPMLFDPKNKLYKHNRNRQKLWHEIANALNLPVELCQIRWKRLREKFQKQTRSGIESNNLKISSLMDSLTFLKPYLFEDGNLQNSSTWQGKTNESSLQDFISECEPNSPLPQDTIEESSLSCHEATSSQVSHEDPLSTEDRHISNPTSQKLEIERIVAGLNAPAANYDGLDHFGLSIANDLRDMEPSEQRRVKLEIAVILANCQYKDY